MLTVPPRVHGVTSRDQTFGAIGRRFFTTKLDLSAGGSSIYSPTDDLLKVALQPGRFREVVVAAAPWMRDGSNRIRGMAYLALALAVDSDAHRKEVLAL